MTEITQAPRKVPTRRISFADGMRDVPKHFAVDGDLLLSHFGVALSALFPDGEDYFVRSVRHFRDDITDPELKRQVTGFIGQEATHGREHREFNDHMAKLGYPVKIVERLTKWGLAAREKVTSAKSNLAVTAALEHFTATLAEVVLTNSEVREHFGHPEVRNLFVWHALEESEHKAVAFDVYKAVGGTERTRVWVMKGLLIGFPVGVGVQMLASLLLDRDFYKPRKVRASWRRFKASPVFDKSVRERLRDYNRPDFHPDDYDNAELIEQWRNELFGDAGTLNDRLAGRAA